MDKQIAAISITSLTVLGFTGMLCCAGVISSKDHKIVKKLNKTLDDISEGVVVEDSVIEKAVDKAVETKLKNLVISEVRNTIEDEVRTSVSKAYNETKYTVKQKLESQCDRVDIDRIVKEIQDRSVDETMKKLTKYMEEVTNDYVRRLKRLQDKEVIFRQS